MSSGGPASEGRKYSDRRGHVIHILKLVKMRARAQLLAKWCGTIHLPWRSERGSGCVRTPAYTGDERLCSPCKRPNCVTHGSGMNWTPCLSRGTLENQASRAAVRGCFVLPPNQPPNPGSMGEASRRRRPATFAMRRRPSSATRRGRDDDVRGVSSAASEWSITEQPGSGAIRRVSPSPPKGTLSSSGADRSCAEIGGQQLRLGRGSSMQLRSIAHWSFSAPWDLSLRLKLPTSCAGQPTSAVSSLEDAVQRTDAPGLDDRRPAAPRSTGPQ
jgi:hypothetical protein